MKPYSTVILIFLTFAAYYNSLHGAFLYDDWPAIRQPYVTDIKGVIDIIPYRFPHSAGNRPLLYATYRLNYYFGKFNVLGYHLLSIIFHSFAVVAAFYIFLEFTTIERAFLGASLFAVHPMATQGVAYVAGRSSSLCAMFCIISILAFVHFLKSKSYIYGVLTGLSLIAACYTKPEMAAMPVLLFCIYRIHNNKNIWVLAPASLLLFVLVWWWFGIKVSDINAPLPSLTNVGMAAPLTVSRRIPTASLGLITYYVPRLIFPLKQSVDPDVPGVNFTDPKFFLALFLLSALAYLLMSNRTPKLLRLAIACIFISPITIRILKPTAEVFEEHHAYFACFGSAFLFIFLYRWISRKDHRLAVSLYIVLLVSFIYLTWSRNHIWQSDITLWEDAASQAYTNPRPRLNLGVVYQRNGHPNEAIQQYNYALRIKPDLYIATLDLASLQMDLGQLNEAEANLDRIYFASSNFPEIFINLGVVYIRRHNYREAVEMFDRAINYYIDKGDNGSDSLTFAYINKGEALEDIGDIGSAEYFYDLAYSMRPDIDFSTRLLKHLKGEK